MKLSSALNMSTKCLLHDKPLDGSDGSTSDCGANLDINKMPLNLKQEITNITNSCFVARNRINV